MTTTSPLTGSAYISSLNSSGASSSQSGSASIANPSLQLNEQDFLELMTTQIKTQDPLNPLQNSEFFSQIAQLSTVSGIDQLNSGFSSLSSQLTSSQSLQAASLVGHYVLVPGSDAPLTSAGLAGAVEVPSSGDVTVRIHDASGAVVRTLDLGTQSSGTLQFGWDGKDNGGNALPEGTYSIDAAVSAGGKSIAASTDVAAQVQSVTLGSNGLTLNLNGIGSTAFSNVIQII
jgi:flagellar basal-body rod modification protein FlgD